MNSLAKTGHMKPCLFSGISDSNSMHAELVRSQILIQCDLIQQETIYLKIDPVNDQSVQKSLMKVILTESWRSAGYNSKKLQIRLETSYSIYLILEHLTTRLTVNRPFISAGRSGNIWWDSLELW